MCLSVTTPVHSTFIAVNTDKYNVQVQTGITFSYSKAVYRNLGCDYEAHLCRNLGNFHV